METLKSFVGGKWHTATSGFRDLHDPSTEDIIARASSDGVDFAAAASHARTVGGPALRSLNFTERGAVLAKISKVLGEAREELIDLSMKNTGVTRRDAKFDLDGATGTLAYYGYKAKELGEDFYLRDGDGEALGRSARFWGQHVHVPLQGVAVLVGAYNFPAWGFAEKMACAFLAGVPVIVKPATSTAWVAARCAEIIVESGAAPEGTFSFVAGSTGDLLDHLGPQDVLAFTGSASTGLALRSHAGMLAQNVRVNVEADSLNAAVLAPDLDGSSDTMSLFYREIVREITQKTGQKCTAVRRIFVPEDRCDEVIEELRFRLGDVVPGDPRDEQTTMGPLCTSDQLVDTVEGVAALQKAGAELVLGTGARSDGAGATEGKGYFFAPHLLRAPSADAVSLVHEREVFGPVSTVIPYAGDASEVAEYVARGRGSLVTSIYSDDESWVGQALATAGAWNGRLYLASAKMAEQAVGSGLALPQSKHGGPGRAGGGEELGGIRGLSLYMNRVALQGSKTMIERLL